MTITIDTRRQIHNMIDDLNDDRDPGDWTHAQIITIGGTWIIELSRRADTDCPRCDQPLWHAGSVRELAGDGSVQGTYDQAHGCGEWCEPVSVLVTVSDEFADGIENVAEITGSLMDRDVQVTVDSVLEAVEKAYAILDTIVRNERDGG